MNQHYFETDICTLSSSFEKCPKAITEDGNPKCVAKRMKKYPDKYKFTVFLDLARVAKTWDNRVGNDAMKEGDRQRKWDEDKIVSVGRMEMLFIFMDEMSNECSTDDLVGNADEIGQLFCANLTEELRTDLLE